MFIFLFYETRILTSVGCISQFLSAVITLHLTNIQIEKRIGNKCYMRTIPLILCVIIEYAMPICHVIYFNSHFKMLK